MVGLTIFFAEVDLSMRDPDLVILKMENVLIFFSLNVHNFFPAAGLSDVSRIRHTHTHSSVNLYKRQIYSRFPVMYTGIYVHL